MTQVDVRIFNTNTSRLLVETVALRPDGKFDRLGSYRISGVRGTGSEVKIAFVEPAGSMTGRLFPSGERQEYLHVIPLEPSTALFNVSQHRRYGKSIRLH